MIEEGLLANEALETNGLLKLKRYGRVVKKAKATVGLILSFNVVFCEGKMTADSEMDIKEAFQRAQKGHNNKAKLVASLNSRYNKVSDMWCLMYF